MVNQRRNQRSLAASAVALSLLLVTGCGSKRELPDTAADLSKETASELTSAGSTRDALYRGDLQAQQQLAAKVITDIERGITTEDFQTGNSRFDGEWAVGSYQLAVLGLGKILMTHPELKSDYLPVMEQAVEQLVSPELNNFATQAWGEKGLTEAVLRKSPNAHAYLGYTNLALSMLRQHKPQNRFTDLNDLLTDKLVSSLKKSGHGITPTYPNEAYPPDLAAVLGSIALHNQSTGGDRSNFLEIMLENFQTKFIDPSTGLVFQAVDAETGNPTDLPRASGTALAVYYLSFIDLTAAQALFQSIADNQQSRTLGLVGIKEYAPGQDGMGDVDSGELIMGISPSATMFALGGARLTDDRALYNNLYSSIQLLGNSSLGEQNGISLLESPLGNAMMLAMLTAQQLPEQAAKLQ